MAKFAKGDKAILIDKNNIINISVGEKRFTHFGEINTTHLIGKEEGAEILTSTGKKFLALKANLKDFYEYFFKRCAQIILPKDSAIILWKSGVNKNSLVLEAGTGSGAFAIFAANFVKKVLSYEIRKDFIELAKENLKNSGLKNVEILERDVLKEGFSKKNADLVLLDMMDAHKALRFAKEALRVGGVVCVYSPVIEQVQNSLKEMKKLEFSQIELFECLEREWKTEPLRPLSKGIFHTAFLLFGRKIAENAPGAI